MLHPSLRDRLKPQQRGHEEATTRGEPFTRVAKEIGSSPVRRAAFGEFINAQVKTMSFLAYLMRVYQDKMADFLPQLPAIVVRLLQDCPREKSATRKELLVAIRHVINSNFRTIFLNKLDDLMDERTLIGDGLTTYENSRTLAYTMLADLVHHVRDRLTQAQIRKTIVVYSGFFHDDSPGANFQTMSAKLLFNMAECMAKVEDLQAFRSAYLLVSPPVGYVTNLATMSIPNPFSGWGRKNSGRHGRGDSNHDAEGGMGNDASEMKLVQHLTLAIYGDHDSFVMLRKMREWTNRLMTETGSLFRAVEVSGAGHFWIEEGTIYKLRDAVGAFGIELLNTQMPQERDSS